MTQNNLLNQISQELTNHHTVLGKHLNYFKYNDNVYALDEALCQKIYDILNEIKNDTAIDLLRKKYRVTKLLKKIRVAINDIFKEAPQNDNDDTVLDWKTGKEIFFKLIKNDKQQNQIATIINDSISHLILEHFWDNLAKQQSKPMALAYFDISLIIGVSVTQWWITSFIKKGDYDKYDTTTCFKVFCKKYAIDSSSVKLAHWFYNIVHHNYDDKDYVEYSRKLAIKVGSHFVEYLLKHKIFTETTINGINNSTKAVVLANNYFDKIICSKVFTKPPLCPNLTSKPRGKININSYEFSILGNDKQNPKFKHELKDDLKNILMAKDVKYCINTTFLKMYNEYVQEIMLIPFNLLLAHKASDEAIKINNFIYITYNIDFQKIISSFKVTNKTILYQMLAFIQNPEQFFDTELRRKLFISARRAYKKLQNFNKEYANLKTGTINTLEDFINISLNNNLNQKKYRKYLQQYSESRILLEMYYKVSAQKFFIIHFLKEAEIYKHFSYFYLEKELSGVGRIQTPSYLLSFQTNKFARLFISYYTNDITVTTSFAFNKLKLILKDILHTVKDPINAFEYSKFEEETAKLQEEYLTHFLKKNINKQNLDINFEYLDNAINSMLPLMKKPKETLNALSILHYMKFKKEYLMCEPIVFLDSTTSGTQHLAAIFKNGVAAKYGCLSGTDYFDINTYVLTSFVDYITKTLPTEAQKCLTAFGLVRETVYNMSCKEFYKTLYKSIIKEELTEDFLLRDFLAKMNNKIQNNSEHFNLTDVVIHKQLFTILNFGKQPDEKLFDCVLLVIADYAITNLLTSEPWLLENTLSREIIKKRIMADAYGMTARGGVDAIYAAFFEKATESGNFNINLNSLRIYANILSKYFGKYFRHEKFKYMIEYLKLRSFTTKKAKIITGPLIMSTEYLTWTYSPKKIKTLRINVKRLKTGSPENTASKSKQEHRRFINLAYISKELDTNKITNAFAAFMIHTQEARLMILWLITAQHINIMLQKELNIEYFYTPNYDCFGTNFKHIAFFKLSLQHCYNMCYENGLHPKIRTIFDTKAKKSKEALTFFDSLLLKASDPDYWNGEITNSFFVKH